MAGRPTKLTAEVKQIIADVLSNCGSRSAACGRANISINTFHEWLARGAVSTKGPYAEFLIAVRDAEARAVLLAVRTVRLAMVGGWHQVPMRDRDGNYGFRRDAETSEILRDAQGQPQAELVDEYRKPNDALAARFLERRDRENWGGGAQGVTVNPAPARPRPNKRETLNLFGQAVQILRDSGMKLPESKVPESIDSA